MHMRLTPCPSGQPHSQATPNAADCSCAKLNSWEWLGDRSLTQSLYIGCSSISLARARGFGAGGVWREEGSEQCSWYADFCGDQFPHSTQGQHYRTSTDETDGRGHLETRLSNIRQSDHEGKYAKSCLTTGHLLFLQDSNQFHAVCLDTYPPIFYLNNTSKMIIQLITKYNEIHKEIKVKITQHHDGRLMQLRAYIMQLETVVLVVMIVL